MCGEVGKGGVAEGAGRQVVTQGVRVNGLGTFSAIEISNNKSNDKRREVFF